VIDSQMLAAALHDLSQLLPAAAAGDCRAQQHISGCRIGSCSAIRSSVIVIIFIVVERGCMRDQFASCCPESEDW
jgi:hypothetical protein